MTKLFAVPFTDGRPKLSPSEESTIIRQTFLAPLKAPLHDPATLLVVIGYLDGPGDADENKRIALRRAQLVIDLLHDKCQFTGSSQGTTMSVGDLPAKDRANKKAVVEIWMVDP